MTQTELDNVWSLWREGKTYREISNIIGYSESWICEIVCRNITKPTKRGRARNNSRCVYPAISNYMVSENIGWEKMSERCGICPQVFYFIATGKHEAKLSNAIKIAQVIGKPVENVFRR